MARRSRIWLRGAVGWIAAYALVLQTTLAAFAGHPNAPFDPASRFDLAVLCHNGGNAPESATPTEPGAPQHKPHLDNHCALCAAAGPTLALAIAPVIEVLVPDGGKRPLAATDQVAGFTVAFIPGYPRAPPAFA